MFSKNHSVPTTPCQMLSYFFVGGLVRIADCLAIPHRPSAERSNGGSSERLIDLGNTVVLYRSLFVFRIAIELLEAFNRFARHHIPEDHSTAKHTSMTGDFLTCISTAVNSVRYSRPRFECTSCAVERAHSTPTLGKLSTSEPQHQVITSHKHHSNGRQIFGIFNCFILHVLEVVCTQCLLDRKYWKARRSIHRRS